MALYDSELQIAPTTNEITVYYRNASAVSFSANEGKVVSLTKIGSDNLTGYKLAGIIGASSGTGALAIAGFSETNLTLQNLFSYAVTVQANTMNVIAKYIKVQ